MKEKINKINQSIEEKKDRLKEKASRYIDAIVINSDSALHHGQNTTKSSSVPPISYLLYGISGLSAICALATDSKILSLCISAASAFGGYKFSNAKKDVATKTSANSNISVAELKNEITSKVLDAVKKTTNEWEDFMGSKQKEVQEIIASSLLDDNQKDAISSKIFLYEVIDISISEFSSMMSSAVNVSDIKTQLNLYKSKLLSAIDMAATKQIAKYNSLV